MVCLNCPIRRSSRSAKATRNDLIDVERDPRLTTRHFDLLIAAAIAWQMKDYAQVTRVEKEFVEEEPELLYPSIGI